MDESIRDDMKKSIESIKNFEQMNTILPDELKGPFIHIFHFIFLLGVNDTFKTEV